MVQTGAKMEFGGLKLGLFKVVYQSFTELWVAKLERKPIKRQMATAIPILTIFFFFMVGATPSKIRIYLYPLDVMPTASIIFVQKV